MSVAVNLGVVQQNILYDLNLFVAIVYTQRT